MSNKEKMKELSGHILDEIIDCDVSNRKRAEYFYEMYHFIHEMSEAFYSNYVIAMQMAENDLDELDDIL